LRWDPAAEPSIGEADLAVQLIADSELAVNRAVVEVWKLIQDEALPLDLVGFYSGYAREDRRSWLGFHDCVSNMEPDQRRVTIEVDGSDAPWMQGGTYMAFLRLAIDLAAWRNLRREHQELLVGRDKLTGCPLVQVAHGAYGELVPIPSRTCAADADYVNPPRPSDPLLQASHIHRANMNRTGPDDADSNRIFRQGYEFLEPLPGGGFRAGLNFVSFQRRLSFLNNILMAQVWLGEVNFGGPRVLTAGLASVPLLTVMTGGYYAVPPMGEPFPGADIF
jgi:deferrochelatase/peroxidase EfeB